jgi:hypothetical protein
LDLAVLLEEQTGVFEFDCAIDLDDKKFTPIAVSANDKKQLKDSVETGTGAMCLRGLTLVAQIPTMMSVKVVQ